MTAEQTASARAAAVTYVRAQPNPSTGRILANVAPSDWTLEERQAYNKALAAYISSHPADFTDQDLLSADLVSKNMYSALQDDSFDFGMFVAESVKPVADAAQSVGNGVLTVANAAKWAIPLLAVVVIGGALVIAYNKAKSA